MNKKPLISIIITTYNRVNLLKKAILSSINQTYQNIEIVICDNHSTDGTEELCKKYMKEDKRIKYFRHEKNEGITYNINYAYTKICGEYFVVVCDDDYIDNDYIEKSLTEFKKHPDYSFIAPTCKIYTENDEIVYNCPKTKLDYNNVAKRLEEFILSNRNYGFIIIGLMKTSILKEIFEEEDIIIHNRFAEDWIVIVKFLIAVKCKMINTTHLRKRSGGYICSIDKIKEILKVETFTIGIEMDKIAEIIAKSFSTDKFYYKYLPTEIQREEMSNVIIKSMEKAKKACLYKRLFKLHNIKLRLKTLIKLAFS